MSVADLMQLGIGGVSLFLLLMVWQEMKIQNAFQRELLTDAQKERSEMRRDLMSLKMKVIRVRDDNDDGQGI